MKRSLAFAVMLAFARARPDQLAYASAGSGTKLD